MLSAPSKSLYHRLKTKQLSVSKQIQKSLFISLLLTSLSAESQETTTQPSAPPWPIEKLFEFQDRLTNIEKSQLTTTELDALKITIDQLDKQLASLQQGLVSEDQLSELKDTQNKFKQEFIRLGQTQKAQSDRVADMNLYTAWLAIAVAFGRFISWHHSNNDSNNRSEKSC